MPSTTSSASGGGIFARVARRLRYKSRKETVSKASETQLTSLSQATSTSRGGGASTLTSSRERVEVREQRVTVKQLVKLASRQTSPNSDDTHTECLICLDSIQDGKTTISMGCACRGDAGFGHVGCKIAAAMHSGIDCSKAWQTCDVCKQRYTGVMHLELSAKRWELASTLTQNATVRMVAATDYGLACVIAGRNDDAAEVFKQFATSSKPHPRAEEEAAAKHTPVYGGAGKDGSAVALFSSILDASLRAYGNDSFRSLSTAGNLAIIFMHAEMYDEAAALLERTASTMKKVLGPEHPHTLRVVVNLGTALDHQGWHEEASAIHRESLRMHTVVFGLAHPDSLVAQGNLAVSLKNQGKYKEAEGLLHSTLDLQRQVLGNQHPDVGSTMHNLAVIKEEQGKHEEACDLFERTLAIKTQALGSTHPSTLKTAYNLQIVRLIILREL